MKTETLVVYGKEIKVKYVGEVVNCKPGEEWPGILAHEVWGSNDMRKFVYDSLLLTWHEYDSQKDGFIWKDGEWNETVFYKRVHPECDAEDLAYEHWCLFNNYRKLDLQAGLFVCGENLFDQEWKQWVEEQLQKGE